MSSTESVVESHPAQVDAPFRIEHPLVDASDSSLGSHQPQLDTSAAYRKFGQAEVNCTFSKIDWGRFENKPACMVCVDVSISWTESYKLERARLCLTVQEDERQGKGKDSTSVPLPKITQVFGPKDPPLQGPRLSVERDRENNLHMQIPTPIGSLDTPSRKSKNTYTNERLWEISTVRRPAPKDRVQRILRCGMEANTLTQIVFPNTFRLGLIVEHHGFPFVIRFTLNGSVLGIAKVMTFGASRKLSKLNYSFKPEDSSKVFTRSEFFEYLNEVNGPLLSAPESLTSTENVATVSRPSEDTTKIVDGEATEMGEKDRDVSTAV